MGRLPKLLLKKIFMEVLEKNRLELVQESILNGMDCPQYRDMVHDYALTGKTTGEEQSEPRINFTQLNDRRMNRWDKTFKLPEETLQKLSKLDRELIFLVITESWCGDAAASLPVVNKIAESSSRISLKVVLRDENPELMEAFLTNGTQSIPKVIVLDGKNQEIVGEWGPRPQGAAEMVETCKIEHGKLTDACKQELQVWYNKDRGESTLKEIFELLALE
ncbi:thioredoxin family protein [Flagellimonas pelagia]|uniref:thioredoxin family protein n=1 Tax=Flagellimonas pelagia TaxID=2306998 RepID=UPI001F1FAC55|nr:thioredoxin family protein [Allomuricauda maritima]